MSERPSDPVPRVEDDRLLRGRGRFVANLDARDCAHVVFVRATVAHARLVAVDTADAATMPGVLGVFTAADVDLPDMVPEPAMIEQSMTRPYLSRAVVRFVGEPIALVAATTEAGAVDAAERVLVEYEPLPAVVDVRDALAGETVLHPAAGTNVALRVGPLGEDGGGDERDMSGSDAGVVTVTIEQWNNRVAIAPLEGRAVLAAWRGGMLTVAVSGQGPHPHRDRFAAAFGCGPELVRVVSLDVGGAFGAKAYPYPEEILTAWAARTLGVQARFVDTRTESMATLGHGRGQLQRITLTGRRDGTLLHAGVDIVQDCGAYPRLGAFLPNMTRTVLTGPYRLRSVRYEATSVVTNTNPVVAYRGAGQPEAAALMERAVDRFATEIGMDPIEVRRRNLIGPSEFPFTNVAGLVYDSGDYAQGLDVLVAATGYDALRAEQRARLASGARRVLGIGVASFIESCSTSNHHEHASVAVNADGSVDAWTGTTPSGQGHATTWAMLVAGELGVPIDRITVSHGESMRFPTGTVTGGSRSVQVGGVAIRRAAAEVRDAAARLAAELLEANAADIVYDRATQRFHVAGSPARGVALAEAAAASPNGCIEAILRFDPSGGTVSSGAYLAVVEVDIETGGVEVVRFVAVDDGGTIVHPQLFEGQVHGGVAQGLGQALYEQVVYDADGNLRTANLAEYAMPSAAEIPSIEAHTVQTPTPRNELGAKGVGESGPIGAVPAVHNAVIDALVPLGVRHLDLPLTPERVWQAVHLARRNR